MAEIKIRQAKLYDVPAMARIERDSFGSPWSADEITKDVTARGNVYVAVLGERHGIYNLNLVIKWKKFKKRLERTITK